MLWGSTSAEVLDKERIERVMKADAARRKEFAERARILADDLEDAVKAEVVRIFADPTNATRVAVLADFSLNVARYVCEELYATFGAKRRFMRDAEEDEVYRRVREDLVDFNAIGAEIAFVAGSQGTAVVQVLPGEPELVIETDEAGAELRRVLVVGDPRIRVFRPHEITVIPWDDEPGVPRVVMYEFTGPNGKTWTVVWTDAEHYVIDDSGTVHNGPNGGRNPFGQLPFFAVHRDRRTDSFWDLDVHKDLYLFTKQWLAGLSGVNNTVHNQSFVQLLISGVRKGWPPPEKAGPGSIWIVDAEFSTNDTKIEAVDLQVNPAPLMAKFRDQLALKLPSYGLAADRFIPNPGQAPPSGLARFFERQNLIERRRKHHGTWERAERKLAELFRVMWNWNRPRPEQIARDARFDVEILEETIVLSPTEEAELERDLLANAKTALALGLKTEAEIVATFRKITLAEAERFVEQRKASPRPEIFAYDQDNALATIDELRAAKGMGPHPRREIGMLTVPEFKAELEARKLAAAAGASKPTPPPAPPAPPPEP